MNTSIISLYAKAVAFRPACEVVDIPDMPACKRQKIVTIADSDVNTYDAITNWRCTRSKGVHPNYMQTLSLPMQLDMMVQDLFPFKPLGLVHIGNQINVYNLPVIGQKLFLMTEFGNIYFHKKGWLFEVFTKAYDFDFCSDLTKVNDNEPLVIGNSLYLARMQHDKSKLAQISDKSNDLPEWLRVSQTRSSRMLGSSQKLKRFDFESDIGRRYAKVSGDYNPIHLHSLTAKMLGFKRAIAHGMFSKAIAISELQNHNCLNHDRFQINSVFLQPIALPASVDMHANINLNQCHSDFLLTSDSKFKSRVHLSGEVCELN